MAKKDDYEILVAQVEGLIEMEPNHIATLGNVSAAIKQFLPESVFAGFYLYDGEELVLAPFQGSVSCTRIALGKGVCGESAEKNETIIVDDVTKRENYIQCDSAAMSEIVVPMYAGQKLVGVLDLDAPRTAAYDDSDKEYLEQVAKLLTDKLEWK